MAPRLDAQMSRHELLLPAKGGYLDLDLAAARAAGLRRERQVRRPDARGPAEEAQRPMDSPRSRLLRREATSMFQAVGNRSCPEARPLEPRPCRDRPRPSAALALGLKSDPLRPIGISRRALLVMARRCHAP